MNKNRYLCLRTCVTHVSGLYTGEGRGEGSQNSINRDLRQTSQKDRTISPQQLIYYRDNWYIAAFCHYRKELRVFAIDNISSAKILEQPANKSRAKWVADESWIDWTILMDPGWERKSSIT